MTIRVNIRTAANMSGIRRERRNGRDKIIVPSATLPDDVVMNGILYPADEIAKGFATLNGTLAPLGHPMVDGKFVSALHPEGINIGWIGAHNENVRRENGRVFLDKVIDVARAKESEGGRAVLEAIEKGDPIHTSTGLLCDLEDAEGEGFAHIARNMQFDHDAILLGEEGAATPEQGVGMLVNANGEREEIKVINSYLDDEADYLLERAADLAFQAIEARRKAPLLDRVKAALSEVFGGERNESSIGERIRNMDKGTPGDGTGGAARREIKRLRDAGMTMEDISDALSGMEGDVERSASTLQSIASGEIKNPPENLVEALRKIRAPKSNEVAMTKEEVIEAIQNAVKPLIEAQAEMKANQEARAKADHDALVNKVVEAGIEGFGREVAENMDTAALNAVLALNAARTQKAAPLASGFFMNTDADDCMSPLSWGVKQ